MSQTCDYFMNYDGSLAELADIVRFAIGVQLSPCDETSHNLCGFLFGMQFFLGTHDFENDQGIAFEDYRYNLGLKTYLPEGDLRPLHVQLSTHWQVIASRLPARSLTSDAELSVIDYLERTDRNDT